MRPAINRKELPLFGPVPARRDTGNRAWTRIESGGTARLVQARNRLRAVPPFVRPAAMGFVLGAVFWHFVGFWSFISHIVFASPETARPVTAAAIGSAQASPVETGSLQRLEKLTAPKIEESCTALVRDTATGQTRQSACRRLAHPFKMKTASERQDRVVVSLPQKIEQPSLELDQDLPLQWPLSPRQR